MGEPIRVQRKRSKGWKMPENTVYVGRPTKWGNPFIVGKPGGAYTKKVQDQRHAWQLYDSVARDREAEVRAACVAAVPTNWCDPLLTGPNVPRGPLDNRGVEKLLLGIIERIRAAAIRSGGEG